MPPSELPVLAGNPRPYRLPRRPGAGRRIAPTLPFSHTGAVLSAIGGRGSTSAEQPQVVTVRCGHDELAGLAERLARTGVAGLRLLVKVDGVPGVTPATVRALGEIGVAELEIVGDTTVTAEALPAWIELNKAALLYRLPLAWSGRLPGDIGDQLVHLVPARDQPDWSRRWRYGMSIWRRGPGFAFVVDARDEVRQFTLSLPVITDLFGPELDRPAEVTGTNEETVAELAAAGLVLVAGTRASWLPYRVRRWPIGPLL